jgi:hypothetical protein
VESWWHLVLRRNSERNHSQHMVLARSKEIPDAIAVSGLVASLRSKRFMLEIGDGSYVMYQILRGFLRF